MLREMKVDSEFMKQPCPFCGSKVIFASNFLIYGKEYGNGRCYKCTKCDAYVGCHPSGKPLGTLANKELRSIRKSCHSLFDPIWKEGYLQRNEAYKQLADIINIPRKDLHFAKLNLEDYKRLNILNHVIEFHKQIMGDFN